MQFASYLFFGPHTLGTTQSATSSWDVGGFPEVARDVQTRRESSELGASLNSPTCRSVSYFLVVDFAFSSCVHHLLEKKDSRGDDTHSMVVL